ncbi:MULTISPECIES: peptide chain release factor 1 [unclassified Fusibacter]|uniref:peptide chain release factor 1 n=1 Tax=unclassified Fusibacter TaxID=2624464 RepID=UPI0010104FF2|nr:MULTISPECIES: peptide chain release factor 1 [unclassified Fusibacter]MCK8059877.1 peptide chain release factor 1 [Fusibacter sp. A2]NPE21679.1 peptide chain release factor 1 [Fusibacter sp. A1]RXV62082.1 peptide chain release factor 1 [Fusibacter sp. A1]
MLDKLVMLEEKFIDLEYKISDPEIINNQNEWQKFMKEHADIAPIINVYREFKQVMSGIEEAKEILETEKDEEMRELAKMELKDNEERELELREELRLLLLPKDPNDDKNVIVEIRAGAGGDEAGLFAGELQRLYMRYAEKNRWKVDMMSTSETGVGGVKEAIFMIEGKGAYSRLKFESGIHRVQRVPATESQGRIHTSTATVAVLPEIDDVEVEVRKQDLRIDVFRSSGNGGQSVNTTDSAVRITHLPTGIVVSCQDGKSQLKNKDKAMKVLTARLYEMELAEQQSEIAEDRKSQLGTGDRSGKIRTYNFPQGRVTDHRIPITLYKLAQFMEGEIDEIIDALITMRQAEMLAETE